MIEKSVIDRLLKEMQPELDRQRADHDRFMDLLAKMPPLSDDQKRAIAEANSPEGWQKALDEVTAKILEPTPRKFPVAGMVLLLAIAILTVFVVSLFR